MTVRRLDAETGDIITSGEMPFITGQDEIAQTIKTRLRLFYGEYFRDVTDGTPWFQRILGKGDNLDAIESILRTRIAETKGVIKLTAFSMNYDLDLRKLEVAASVLTLTGIQDITFNG